MSVGLRQRNIFSNTEEWDIVFEAFKHADFTSYDSDEIYRSMTNYIREHYGDDFNDFIRSSEVFAHVNLISYLGQGIAMRGDINAGDNYAYKSQRKDNILNMAYMVTGQPRRNICAHGMLKIVGVETTEDVYDANKENLSSRPVLWNQEGVFDWKDRFTRIIRVALSPDNPLGYPTKTSSKDGTSTHIYRLNQTPSYNTNYNFEMEIESSIINVNVVPSTISENGEIIEEMPDSETPFNIILRNDGNGNSSPNSGYFVLFKEGYLRYQDNEYEFPKYHRREMIGDENINDSDVWVHEIDEEENTIDVWTPVEKEIGQNITYNNIDPTIRKIYFTRTHSRNRVEILYGDTHFSSAPIGKIRTWYRVSRDATYEIPENYIDSFPVEIPYTDHSGRHQVLTIYLSNVNAITNAQKSPSHREIIDNASNGRFTQERMVNRQDYNIFPLSKLQGVRKLQTIRRDTASKSKYIHLDTHDPTGAHSNLKVNADDGYIYSDYYEVQTRFMYDDGKIDRDSFTQTTIEQLISRPEFYDFYINTAFYSNHIADTERFNMEYSSKSLFWMNTKRGVTGTRGYFYHYSSDEQTGIRKVNFATDGTNHETKFSLIRPGSIIQFVTESNDIFWSSIVESRISRGYTEWMLSSHVPNNATPRIVIPGMTLNIQPVIRERIERYLNRQESFGLHYNFENDSWEFITRSNMNNANEKYDVFEPNSPMDTDNRWLVQCNFIRDDISEYYEVIARGSRMIFGSERQVRFFFSSDIYSKDIKNSADNRDYVNVHKSNAFTNPAMGQRRALFVSRVDLPTQKF